MHLLRLADVERPLPRYFFHLNTTLRTTDDEGLELDGLKQAREEAIRTCGEMMRDAADGFWGSRPWSITITDDAGLIFYELAVDGFAAQAADEPLVAQ